MPFKLLRSPSSATDRFKNPRLSFNFFYFATGDTQKDSGLEIEFLLATGASSSIISHRTFREICQNQNPITVKRSTTQTKTYSGQVVPMIGFTTISSATTRTDNFSPVHSLDNRNEDSKLFTYGLLSEANIWHSLRFIRN